MLPISNNRPATSGPSLDQAQLPFRVTCGRRPGKNLLTSCSIGRVLLRRQPDPGRKTAPRCEGIPVADLGNPCGGAGRARDLRRPPVKVGIKERRSTRAFGSSASCTTIWDTSTWSRKRCSPSTTRSARGCHPCLGYGLLPMSPGRTMRVLAEREAIKADIAISRACSPAFKKHLRHRRELCTRHHARSRQFACNLQVNMCRRMGETVGRKVEQGR